MTHAGPDRPSADRPASERPALSFFGEAAECIAGRRRRGPALEQAIYAAALSEMSAHGLDAMTMEGVAAKARTGKASLYRRWSSKEDLVLEAVGCAMPALEDIEQSTGSLRDDLLGVLRRMLTFVQGPNGALVRGLIGAADVDHPLRLMARTRLIEPRLHLLRRLIEQAIERGEARSGSATLPLAQVGPALLLYRFMLLGHVADDDVLEIVDEVVLPLLRA